MKASWRNKLHFIVVPSVQRKLEFVVADLVSLRDENCISYVKQCDACDERRNFEGCR